MRKNNDEGEKAVRQSADGVRREGGNKRGKKEGTERKEGIKEGAMKRGKK